MGLETRLREPRLPLNFMDNDEDRAHDIGAAVAALGLSQKSRKQGGHNLCIRIEHGDDNLADDNNEFIEMWDRLCKVNDKEYHYTGGFYRFGINQVGGGLTPLLFPLRRRNWYP
jgi:hypothetical protein